MMDQIKRFATGWIFVFLTLLMGSGPAMAISRYLSGSPDGFNLVYPASLTGVNAQCNTCHSRGGGTDLNAYGRAWAEQHNSGMSIRASFLAIEGVNSDGDPTGSSNKVEIDASAQPGWTPGPVNTFYDIFTLAVTATNQSPPTITGNVLDPAAAANQAPVLAPIGAKSVSEGQLLTFTATATDPDGNALTFSAGNLPTGATFTPAGVFSWTPTFTQSGNYNVTITVTDNGSPAQSDFEIVTITVGNVNRPPVLGAIAASQTATEGVSKTIPISATDPDGDAMTFAGSNLPTGATLTDNLNGTATFAWTPDFAQAGSFPNVTITVTDNGSPPQSATAQFTITVLDANRPPVLAPIGAKTTLVGQLLAFTATATDPDADAITFSAGNLPAGATLTPAGAFSWTPTSTQSGNFSVTITATDNGNPPQSASETFTITVGNVDRPPVLNPIGAKVVDEGQMLAFTATASDPDGDALTFASANLPAGATLTPAGAFSWTPGFTQAGNFSVTITVSDGTLTASETFTITVGNVNRPPVLSPSPIGNRTVNVGQTLTIAITASDPDGDAITFSSANLPTGATLLANGPDAATFSWTPAADQTGTFLNLTITASDGTLTDSEVFTVTVPAVAVNQPPVVTNPGNKTATVGQLLSFTITGTDPDGNALAFASANLPTGATLSSAGAFSWTPASDQVGSFTVTVTATDNGSPPMTSAPESFVITVQASAPPPTATFLTINEAEWDDSRLRVEGR
ncbi:MAG TPA: putative Ig domain-containing protein, partial [Gemmatimonadaceae bacterium]